MRGESTPQSYACPLHLGCDPGAVFLHREALAAPENVGREDGERDHEDDPDTVWPGQEDEIHAGVNDAEARIQKVDKQSPPLHEQKPYTDQHVQGGRIVRGLSLAVIGGPKLGKTSLALRRTI